MFDRTVLVFGLLGLVLLIVLFLSSCTGVKLSEPYTLVGVGCQSAEVTTSWQGKTMPTVCKSGDSIHLVATPGHTSMETVESLFIPASIGGAASQFPAEFILELP